MRFDQDPIRCGVGVGLTVDMLAGMGDIGYAEIADEDEDDEGEVKPRGRSDVGAEDLEEGKDSVEDVLGDVGEGCQKKRRPSEDSFLWRTFLGRVLRLTRICRLERALVRQKGPVNDGNQDCCRCSSVNE